MNLQVLALGTALAFAQSSGEPTVLGRPSSCIGEPEGFRFAASASNDGKSLQAAKCFATGSPEECSGKARAPRQAGEILHGERGTLAQYFEDIRYGGDDGDSRHGVDARHLVFYVGHGRPESWVLGDRSVQLERVFLGNTIHCGSNCDEGGIARYLLMCSCNAMAHGPAFNTPYWRCDSTSGESDYREPENFSSFAAKLGSHADSKCLRNIFSRWNHALGPDSRLACGGSSQICDGSAGVPARFWPRYLDQCLPVADAFIAAFRTSAEVPLCIARGPQDPRGSALYDAAFTDNPSGFRDPGSGVDSGKDGSYLHIQYAVDSVLPHPGEESDYCRCSAGDVKKLAESLAGIELPVLELASPTLPRGDGALGSPGLEEKVGAQLSTSLVFRPEKGGRFWVAEGEHEGIRYSAWVARTSGAVFFRRQEPPEPILLDEGEQCGGLKALDLAALSPSQALLDAEEQEDTQDAKVLAMCIDSTKRSKLGEDLARYRKYVVASWKRMIDPCRLLGEERCAQRGLTGLRIPVVGAGGSASVELAPDLKSVVAATRIWRPLAEVPTASLQESMRPVIAYEDALEAAQKRAEVVLGKDIGESGYVRIPELVGFGYKEEDSHCRQNRMWLVYQFRFPARWPVGPRGPDSPPVPPPLTVEVPGQDGVPASACVTSEDG